jgi:hypothetical protein
MPAAGATATLMLTTLGPLGITKGAGDGITIVVPGA